MAKIFLTILNMSITGAFVIAAVCLVRLPLKKAPKIITYCLWAVAGFRLLFPFSIESIFSLIPFNSAPIPADIAMQPVPRIDSGISFVNNAVSSVLPAATPTASVNPLQTWTAIGAYIWAFGVAAMFVYGIASYILLKRKMRGATCVETNIYEAENIKSPFVLGIFKPKIYMPVDLSEKERGYVLLHERTHIKRHDHIIKFAAYFILCLHWFNPLAWLAFLLMGVDMEMSCDERVLKEMGGDTKTDYSRSLLSLATERRIIGGSPLAFGEGGVKQRIKNVLNFRKPSRVIIVAAVTLVAVLSVGFAVNKAVGNPLIEMKMVYEENPAHWLKDMKLVWDDNDYFVTYSPEINIVQRGKEIGYATDELSTWRIYELRGYEKDYLLAVESDAVWRVMSVYPPETPWRQYILENATERDKFERTLSFTLYNDGSAAVAESGLSSYALIGPYFYEFTEGELIIYSENRNENIWFDVVDDNTIIFKDASIPLRAEKGARYVAAKVDNDLNEKIHEYLEIIMSSPLYSSNSGDYIKEHQSEYDAILDMGITALPALTDILNSGDRGLRGNIAALAVNDIIERESNKPHSEEIDAILRNAGSDIARWSRSFLIEPTENNINIYDKIYLGMPSSDVSDLFGEPDYMASGLMWVGYNDVGTFDVMGSFAEYRTDIITRFQNSEINWNIDELIKAAVMEYYADDISVANGEYPAEWHQILSFEANANEFTVGGISQYERYLPDGEYNVGRVNWEYTQFKMTFAKNANYAYELTSYNIYDGVWAMGMPPQQKCYDEAMYYFVGAIPSSGRFGIGAGTAVVTDYAESLTPDGEFLIKYFPGATLSIEEYDEEYATYKPGNWVIEYADSGKNIAVGKDGIDAIIITDDLIGIYNVNESRYDMKFEKYIKNK